MEHLAALGREDAPRQAFGPLLSDELRFDAAVQRSNDDVDRFAILVLAEEPGVHERGVRNVERVLRNGVERAGHLESLSDREVPGLVRAWDLIRLGLGFTSASE